MAFLVENQGVLGLGVVALLAVIGAAVYFHRQYQATRHEREVERVIESLQVPSLRNVVLPDGVDGLTFIDGLLLTPGGIVVLTLKYREGLLFGGTAVDQWTQLVNGKTVKFANPLYDLPQRRQTVEWHCKDVPTHAWVVFSNAGQFQKGMPAGCCMIDELPARLAPLLNGGQVSAAWQEHWKKLQDLSIHGHAELNPR